MKNRKRFLSLGCTVALVVSLVGVNYGANNGMNTIKAAETKEVEELQETLEELENASGIVSHSDAAGKEETVYVILDGDGNQEKIIVSQWLKNEEGSDEYYQETSDKKLPVEVSVSYELDGKKVTPEELAGKSGHLKLTFTYTNNEYKETMINGKKEKIYQPFMMVSGMMLDNTKATNVTVDTGSIVNTGDDALVFGIAMPGLAESLGLKDTEIEIPEKVTVEADVTDFSLMMTLTVASNRVLSQLGLDDIDTIDDLKTDMDELTSGMKEIVDGATKLSEGTGELADGTEELSDGASALYAGTADLVSGVGELKSGATELDEGALALKNGVGELKSKTPELSTGVSDLKTGATELVAGVNKLTKKNEELTSGASSLEKGIKELGSSLKNEESQKELNALLTGSATFSEGLTAASDGLSQIVTGYNYASGDLKTLIDGLTQYANGLASTGDPTNQAYAGYILQMLETYKGLYNNVAGAQSGVATLSSKYSEIDTGIGNVVGSISDVSTAVNKLSKGAEKLNTGVTTYTAGVTKVSEGASDLKTGITTLNNKVPTLVGGIEELSKGAESLKAGTSKLSAGTTELATGADALNVGTSDLKTGVSKLVSGVTELVNGTGDLKDGVVKFDEEGIQKLADIVNGDLQTYFDRIKALQDYAEEYTSYVGCEEDVECSVKFIYKTDGIKDTSEETK